MDDEEVLEQMCELVKAMLENYVASREDFETVEKFFKILKDQMLK